ncbi:MAG: tRNA (adenosine(37)-N6)-threonylcarbamoyltransferase complex transferase subunit TsaD, partial [Myxococcota bacterium]|nr:tRNA (adenosine(37)-N6)-threonylcarbamoyltransferase complex transferase subunit TsaD [Myxococcota bacterium]
MRVLGIESSCDDTAAAVVGPGGVLADVVHSQAVHAQYGGVVPELAGRAHAEKVVVTVRAALERAGIERPDAVAATAGPGLMGAVLVGLCFGKALAAGWSVPFIGVNHLEAHLLAPLLEEPAPAWPFLSMVVSGGHTTLYLARGLGRYEVIGQTIDDAAGEAYDKVARMLGLGYPGGPVVDRLAAQGDPTAVAFPRPRPGDRARVSRRRLQIPRSPLDMSFSGLKTAVRTHLQRPDRASDVDVCASFQAAVVDVLEDRIRGAAEQTGVDRICIGGGVAANAALRARVSQLGLRAFIPPRSRCTDNGAMIAH